MWCNFKEAYSFLLRKSNLSTLTRFFSFLLRFDSFSCWKNLPFFCLVITLTCNTPFLPFNTVNKSECTKHAFSHWMFYHGMLLFSLQKKTCHFVSFFSSHLFLSLFAFVLISFLLIFSFLLFTYKKEKVNKGKGDVKKSSLKFFPFFLCVIPSFFFLFFCFKRKKNATQCRWG